MMRIHRYDEVDSTQRVARAFIEDGSAINYTCVVAKRQTAGRGRRGRSWLAPEGGLFLSMCMLPFCSMKEAPRLTLGTAQGMLDTLDTLGVRARVKWPNDIVILREGGPHGRLGPFRKVGGVIVEAVRTKGDVLEACIIGVGVNVASPKDGWPEDIALTAGALDDDGFTGSADDVMNAIESEMPSALSRCLVAFPHTLAILRERSATLGRRVEVEGITGEARAIDDEGALVVVDDNGVSHTVRAGDVWLS